MKALLEDAQAQAFALLPKDAPGGFFLRRCLQDHCLWVSDLPRRVSPEALAQALQSLKENGFQSGLGKESALLEIDLSLPRYEALLAPLPSTPPALPEDEAEHPAYGLTRLLLSRAYPLEEQPLAPLRSLLKAMAGPDRAAVLALIPGIHQQCALRLRQGKPLPTAAGRVLAHWLEKGGSL